MKGILWIVLTPSSRDTLIKAVPPRFPKIYVHHVTLFYDIILTPDQESLLGKTFAVEVMYEAWNQSIQAAAVTIPHQTQNNVPHITISSLPEVPPVASNNMFIGIHHTQQLHSPLILEGTVEFKQL